MNKRITHIVALLVMLFCAHASATAQELTVRVAEPLPMDLSASTKSRVDRNGKKCGLVKVQCVLDGLAFHGNVMGEVERKDGEYWVYLTAGTKMVEVAHPLVIPILINIPETMGAPIAPAMTYRLVLGIPEALYAAVVNSGNNTAAPTPAPAPAVATPAPPSVPLSTNGVVKGVVTDAKTGEPLIGCTVLHARGSRQLDAKATDIDGEYVLNDVRAGDVVEFQYVTYRSKVVSFPNAIPQKIAVSLNPGKPEKKEYEEIDPTDDSKYYDLKGTELPARPTKKGTYLRVRNGKPEKYTVK